MVADDALLAEIARRLTAAAPGAEVILFGSQARGDAGPRSDIDILVVEAEPVANAALESVRLRRTLRGLGVAVEIVVMSRSRFDEWRHIPGAFAHSVAAEGRTLVA